MHVGVSKLSIGVNEIGLQVEENGWTNKSERLFVQRIQLKFKREIDFYCWYFCTSSRNWNCSDCQPHVVTEINGLYLTRTVTAWLAVSS